MGGLRRPGLAALAEVTAAAPPFTAHHLGFVFGPRINAGGRVGRCDLGVDLLTSGEAAAAKELALILDVHNRERQAIEKLILEDAVVLASAQHNAPFIFVSGDGWHAGVIGIVAGRLRERFGRPAFVAGFEGGMARGSVRSVPGIDVGALVREAKDAGHLASGGGHAMAAGFSLMSDRADEFQRFLASRFAQMIGRAFTDALAIDALVSPAGATEELVAQIAAAGPYGAGSPEPLVAATDVRVAYGDVVGREHVRLSLASADGARLGAIAFRAAGLPLGKGLLSCRGANVHVVGRLRADRWNGRTRVQLQIEDAATA